MPCLGDATPPSPTLFLHRTAYESQLMNTTSARSEVMKYLQSRGSCHNAAAPLPTSGFPLPVPLAGISLQNEAVNQQ